MKVLITGAGAPGGPGIIKSLMHDVGIDLYIADMNPNASGRFILPDRFFVIPSGNNSQFTDILYELCVENKIEFVFPLVTKELIPLSKAKEKFKDRGIKIIISNLESIQIANNKHFLYEHLHKNEIEVPKYFSVKSLDDLTSASEKLGYPKPPFVIKPCVGNGSRGVRILDESVNEFDLLFREKPNNMYSNLSKIKEIFANHQLPELLACEYLPGEELTIDTLVADGKMLDILIRRRETISNGISTSGKFIESSVIETYIESIVSSLPGLDGPIGFQLKKSTNGSFLLIESNPRIQGTSVASNGLGINLPLRSIYSANGVILPKLQKRSGISFVRYYEELFYES